MLLRLNQYCRSIVDSLVGWPSRMFLDGIISFIVEPLPKSYMILYVSFVLLYDLISLTIPRLPSLIVVANGILFDDLTSL